MDKTTRIHSVSKSFGAVKALEDVSLTIHSGETLALLGHNGAGKTTLFRILLGFIQPDRGSVEILGHTPGSRQARAAISFLPENVAFPKLLSGREVVRLYAALKGVGRHEADAALERVGLEKAADRRCGTYSKGMRQKLGLAQAIVAAPDLVILDEPASGLDPMARQGLYELISEMADQGMGVVLSSHALGEIHSSLHHSSIGRAAILNEGRLVACDTVASLRHNAELPIRIIVRSTHEAIVALHQEMGGTRLNSASLEFACDREGKLKILSSIHSMIDSISDLEIHEPDLEDIFRHYCQKTNEIHTNDNHQGAQNVEGKSK